MEERLDLFDGLERALAQEVFGNSSVPVPVKGQKFVAPGVSGQLPAGPVVAVRINFDDDSLSPPEEVDLVVLVPEEDPAVDRGLGETVLRAEACEALFEA